MVKVSDPNPNPNPNPNPGLGLGLGLGLGFGKKSTADLIRRAADFFCQIKLADFVPLLPLADKVRQLAD